MAAAAAAAAEDDILIFLTHFCFGKRTCLYTSIPMACWPEHLRFCCCCWLAGKFPAKFPGRLRQRLRQQRRLRPPGRPACGNAVACAVSKSLPRRSSSLLRRRYKDFLSALLILQFTYDLFFSSGNSRTTEKTNNTLLHTLGSLPEQSKQDEETSIVSKGSRIASSRVTTSLARSFVRPSV